MEKPRKILFLDFSLGFSGFLWVFLEFSGKPRILNHWGGAGRARRTRRVRRGQHARRAGSTSDLSSGVGIHAAAEINAIAVGCGAIRAAAQISAIPRAVLRAVA